MSVLVVPKSQFKPKAFAYLRKAERGDRVCITDHGRAVADIVPHRSDADRDLEGLRGSVLRFDRPTEPVGAEWEADT